MIKCIKCGVEVDNSLLCDSCADADMQCDAVDHPKHYNHGKFEAIDVIEDWDLGFHLGNVVKYISRAGKKDKNTEMQDLKKALWYLGRKIEKLEKE